jgi:hypothetical protein
MSDFALHSFAENSHTPHLKSSCVAPIHVCLAVLLCTSFLTIHLWPGLWHPHSLGHKIEDVGSSVSFASKAKLPFATAVQAWEDFKWS